MPAKTTDIHAHILSEETNPPAPARGSKIAQALEIDDNRHSRRGGKLSQFPARRVGFWSGGCRTWRRRRWMFRLFPCGPQTFLYGQPPALATVFARIQNEQLANW